VGAEVAVVTELYLCEALVGMGGGDVILLLKITGDHSPLGDIPFSPFPSCWSLRNSNWNPVVVLAICFRGWVEIYEFLFTKLGRAFPPGGVLLLS